MRPLCAGRRVDPGARLRRSRPAVGRDRQHPRRAPRRAARARRACLSPGRARAYPGARGAAAVHPTAAQGPGVGGAAASVGVGLMLEAHSGSTLAALDPADPAFRADPFPAFRRLRREDPVHHCEAVGGWVLTRYVDVLATLRDPRLSADRITPFFESLSEEQRTETRELGDSLRKWTV